MDDFHRLEQGLQQPLLQSASSDPAPSERERGRESGRERGGNMGSSTSTSNHQQQQRSTNLRVAAKPFASKRTGPKTNINLSATSKERLANLQRNKPIAPGQPPPQYRTKDRYVHLPDEEEYRPRLSEEYQRPDGGEPPSSIFEDFDGAAQGARGRITSYCVAESIDRKSLMELLKSTPGVLSVEVFPEVVYARHEAPGVGGNVATSQKMASSDVFYFDYGTVVCWGMSLPEERRLVEKVKASVCVDLLDTAELEVDEFLFVYTSNERPHIQNDVFTINYRYANDHLVKLSVSHALAQSTKLSVYEYRVVDIVDETRDLPEVLASTGKVDLSRKAVAQLMGRVFLQKSAVNLLSSVLDTPDFFWESDIPDSLQHLYEGCCSYLEYENRVEVLNQRFGVLQEMLDMLRDHQNADHSSRLEWIVIILILVEIVIGVFQLLE